MTDNEIALEVFRETSSGERVSAALGRRYARRRVSIPYSTAVFSADIEALDLSVRSYNCLRRAGLNTVNSAAEHGDLRSIRNLGRKSCAEICEKLLDFAYNALPDQEKMEFLRRFAAENADSLRAPFRR